MYPLMWSLIALLTGLQNTRARHLRLLLQKQACSFASENGLALTAYGIRITYVNIIQVSKANTSERAKHFLALRLTKQQPLAAYDLDGYSSCANFKTMKLLS